MRNALGWGKYRSSPEGATGSEASPDSADPTRAAWGVEGGAEERLFKVTLFGGAWTQKAKGVSYDAFKG
eukprot:4667509-Prorocentrum_lima.AAC.1